MKYLMFSIVGFFLIWGTVLVAFKSRQRDDSSAIRKYVKSRGAAPVPTSWRGKVGDGI